MKMLKVMPIKNIPNMTDQQQIAILNDAYKKQEIVIAAQSQTIKEMRQLIDKMFAAHKYTFEQLNSLMEDIRGRYNEK